MQLLSNDEGVAQFSWTDEQLKDIREEMDQMLDHYPDTVISSKYYHRIITTGKMLDRPFGWNECPSVTAPLDKRYPASETSHRFHPVGFGSQNHASMLHLGNPGLFHLQGRRGPYELGPWSTSGATSGPKRN